MGQYQQWLQYQQIDKRLSTQIEALEVELAQLQECAVFLEQQLQKVVPLTDNPIIQALVAQLSTYHTPFIANERYMHETNNSTAPGDSISPALLSWGGLPNFELYEI